MGCNVVLERLGHLKDSGLIGLIEEADPAVETLVLQSPGGSVQDALALGRHLREDKTQHWHLDYLLPATCVREVWFHTGRRDLEHVWAEIMLNYPASAIPLEKLGASDCNCRSHFVRLPTLREAHDLKCLLKGKGRVICHRPV